MMRDILLETVLVPVHRAGWPFIGGLAVATLLLAFVAAPLGWLAACLTAFCAFFFRDPPRMTPTRPGLLVSAADGRVVSVGAAVPPAALAMPATPVACVCVFLSIFDVHVNRMPVDGIVLKSIHTRGAFGNAASPAAGEVNERRAWLIGCADGRQVAVVQIAGLLARRIVSWVDVGRVVRAGERFGLIRFGSRVDVYLPEGVAPLVAPGQRVIGGETVIADLTSAEPQRPAERR
jgi:phosphatidylserine decarboxylase